MTSNTPRSRMGYRPPSLGAAINVSLEADAVPAMLVFSCHAPSSSSGGSLSGSTTKTYVQLPSS